MNRNLFLLLISSLLLLGSCKEDTKDTPTEGEFSKGTFVVNEGTFGMGNGSISHYDYNSNTLTANIFEAVNGRPLGDVVQSITFHEGHAYIVVNNSNKIEVVNAGTFEEVATITGLELPRHFMGVDAAKGYVTEWGSDGTSGDVRIIDLETFTVSGSIPTVGGGAENMTLVGSKVYVGHSGGFGRDTVLTIVDPFSDAVDRNLIVGDNPAETAVDYNGKVWVLCLGYTDWVTYETFPAYLKCINPSTYEEELSLELPANYPADLHISADGTELFFLSSGAVVAQHVDATVLDLRTIAADSYYYSLGYDSSNRRLYAGDAGDFTSQGMIHVFEEDGTSSNSFQGGIVPGDFSIRN